MKAGLGLANLEEQRLGLSQYFMDGFGDYLSYRLMEEGFWLLVGVVIVLVVVVVETGYRWSRIRTERLVKKALEDMDREP